MRNKIITSVVIVCLLFGISSVRMNTSADSTEPDKLELTLIAIDFPDVPHFKTVDNISEKIYGTDGETAHTFWNLASSGKQEIVQGEYKPGKWFRAPKKQTFYAKDTNEKFDINVKELINWTIQKAIADGLEIDKTDGKPSPWNDSYFMLSNPTFCFVMAGEAEGYTNFPKDDGFWPHRSWFNISDEDDEKIILVPYIVVTEDMSYYGSGEMVITHELGHVLSLADLYDYHCGGPYKGTCTYPFTYYDIMVGRHGGRGLIGLHREMLGWMESETISGTGSYELTIPPITTNEKGAYIKIPITGTKEFIGIEYRRKVGIDAFWGGIPSEGIIIYRVNENIWYCNNTDRAETGEHYIKLLNPRGINPKGTEWHDNPCYTSTDISTEIIKAEQTPNPLGNNHTEFIQIQVLSEDESGAKIRVVIKDTIEKMSVGLPETIKVGHLHNRFVHAIFENESDKEMTIKSDYLTGTTILKPFEKKTVTMEFKLPEYLMVNEFSDFEFTLETKNTIFTETVTLKNILPALDEDNNGIIENSEISGIFSYLGKEVKDNVFDVNENGLVEIDDIITVARYVGLKYK